MTDERDDKLAADVARLFSPGDLEAARSNLAAASARARRTRRLTASAGAVTVVAAIAVGAAALNTSDSQQLTIRDTATTDANTADDRTTVTAIELPGTLPDAQAPLADDLEGLVFGSPHLQVTGEDLPRTEEGPGLPGVSLTFYRGIVTWHNGCYSLTGTYRPGAQALEIVFAGPDGVIRPAIGCPNQELVSLIDEIVLARPVKLETWTAPGAGLQLTVSGGPGVLNFGQQPYSLTPIFCVPGVDRSVEGILASGPEGDGAAWSNPVEEVRYQLAYNRDIYQDVELELTLSNATEALVTGTRDGRPVLSAVLREDGETWALARLVACAPDPTPGPD